MDTKRVKEYMVSQLECYIDSYSMDCDISGLARDAWNHFNPEEPLDEDGDPPNQYYDLAYGVQLEDIPEDEREDYLKSLYEE
jgi:hypothetical protein